MLQLTGTKIHKMLKFVDYDIVFQEVPDEVTLAINLSQCPNDCEGCHSPFLKTDIGDELNESTLSDLLQRYADDVTCVGFMGGDRDLSSLVRLATFVKSQYELKVAWYTGREQLPKDVSFMAFDYIKVGPYKREFGPLNKRTTNQRLYKMREGNIVEDVTHLFWK